MYRTVVALALFSAVVGAAISPIGVGAADLADTVRPLDKPGCEDGITTAFTLDGAEAAIAQDEMSAYADAHRACGKEPVDAAILQALCTPPNDYSGDGTRLVLCLAVVGNRGVSDPLAVDPKDFVLVAHGDATVHTARYDNEVLETARHPGGMSVASGDSESLMLVFPVGPDFDPQGGVLAWLAQDAETTGTGDDHARFILLDELDDRVRMYGPGEGPAPEAPTPDTAASEDGSGMTYTGTTDNVIGPLNLAPGLYRVTGSYQGDSNFAVMVKHSNGALDLLFNEIDSYSGEASFEVVSGERVVIDVTGRGAWRLVIEPLM